MSAAVWTARSAGQIGPGAIGSLYELVGSLRGTLSGLGSIVLGGRRVQVPGVVVWSFADNHPCAPAVTDFSPRRSLVQAIVLHTDHGTPHNLPLIEAPSEPSRGCQLARYQTSTDREVSWDFLVRKDGVLIQQADPLRVYTWQAGGVNPRTLGIEQEQGPGGSLTRPQLDTTVALLDVLTRELELPRQLPGRRDGTGRMVPDQRVLARFTPAEGSGARYWGVLGHRNVTDQRGPGDPGDLTMWRLMLAGYRAVDVAAGEDLAFWAGVQRALGIPATGLPDHATTAALRRRGFPSGQLVLRPGDR